MIYRKFRATHRGARGFSVLVSARAAVESDAVFESHKEDLEDRIRKDIARQVTIEWQDSEASGGEGEGGE